MQLNAHWDIVQLHSIERKQLYVVLRSASEKIMSLPDDEHVAAKEKALILTALLALTMASVAFRVIEILSCVSTGV